MLDAVDNPEKRSVLVGGGAAGRLGVRSCARAASVPASSMPPPARPASRTEARRFGIASTAELGGEVNKAVGDHIEIVLGPHIPGLVGTVLERPADERGMEAATAGGEQ